MNSEFPIPKVFISYAWESDLVKNWVKELGRELRNYGIDVQLDYWQIAPGDRMPMFMEMAVRNNDFVLIICTPKYKFRSENRIGGVGYEGDIMTAEVLQTSNYRKFIPILHFGDDKTAVPSWLAKRYLIDFSNPTNYEGSFHELMLTLLNIREQPPPLGKIPIKYQQEIDKILKKQEQAEDENVAIEGTILTDPSSRKALQNDQIPFLEADLIWHGGSRSPRGYSSKNPMEIDEHGRLVTVMGAGVKPIIFWELNWRFDLIIQNNSSYPAFNVQIESVGNTHFTAIEKIHDINIIKPFEKIELKTGYRQFVESIHTVADDILKYKIPENLNGLLLRITYLDEKRNLHNTLVKIEENKLINIMKRFWEVIYDDDNRKMEVIGESINDTLLTNNVFEMQQAGMKVRCNTPDISTEKETIKLPHYAFEKGLYRRLINDYEFKTGKRLKSW